MKAFPESLLGLGLSRAIVYGLVARLWGLLAAPLTMLFVASRFSAAEQGFFYTFASLLGLQIFFELGLPTVVAQYASHEFAALAWAPGGQVTGDARARARLGTLLRRASQWFAAAAGGLVFLVVPIGLWFFSRQSEAAGVAWRAPWVLACCGSACNLALAPCIAVVLGSGEVTAVNRREMAAAILAAAGTWVLIFSGLGLYAACAPAWCRCFVFAHYLGREKPALLRLAYGRGALGSDLSWRREIWPLQWRIALSWASGYFVFQLFNPVLFYYHGPEVAGRMGITLSAANALLALALTWTAAHAPEMGKLVARGERAALDRLFQQLLRQTLVVAASGALAGTAVLAFVQSRWAIGARFLPATQAALLFAAICGHVTLGALATYGRAHKREPFAALSVALAVLQGAVTWLLGRAQGAAGVVSGCALVSFLVAVPFGVILWQRFRRDWEKATVGPRPQAWWRSPALVVIANFPDPGAERDGAMQRVAALDARFDALERVYLDLSFRRHFRPRCESRGPRLTVLRAHAFFSPLLVALLARRARLFYVHSVYNGLRALSVYRQRCVVTDMHGLVPEELRLDGARWRALLFRWVETLALQRSALVITVSDAMARHFAARPRRHPVATLLTLPLVEALAPAIGGKFRSAAAAGMDVLYVGGVQPWQNLELMLDAVARAGEQHRYTFLSGQPEAWARQLAARHLLQRVRLDSVAKADLGDYYRKAQLGFVLRDDDPINRVACPTKLVEYLAHGVVPVVLQPRIGDFETLGYAYVLLADFIARRLPELAALERMAQHNQRVVAGLAQQAERGFDRLWALASGATVQA